VSPDRLAGKVAIVTGAARGMGEREARALAAEGAKVVLTDVLEQQVAEVASSIGDAACGLGHDVTDADAWSPVVETAIERFGGVDVLVNNAGIQHVAPVEDFDPDRFELIHRIMLQAPFLLARAVLPGMYAAGWGRLVHVSSVHGHRASAYKSAYVSAKHGLEGLSKVIALEGAAQGVTSNTVCPGYVRTPLVEGQIADQAKAHGIPEGEVVDDVLLARTALKRLVEPAEVAEAVAFLCGPAAASMTGSSLVIDGGWSAA
jgi:3-hydroxybutyrate dehydrogenase